MPAHGGGMLGNLGSIFQRYVIEICPVGKGYFVLLTLLYMYLVYGKIFDLVHVLLIRN